MKLIMASVTEQMPTKEALRASETRLRRILDTVVAFVGTLTLDGILTEANEPALVAADLKRSDVIGKPFWDCYWWSHSPQVQQQLRDAVKRAARGELVRYDVDIRVAGGALITIDFQLAPNFDAEGNVVELIPSGVDITERKQFEERLRRSHGTFSNLVQNAPFGVYLVDDQFRLAQVSAGAQKVFSSIRPLLGRDFAEVLQILWPEPFASEAIGRFRHTLETGEPYRSEDTNEVRADTEEIEAYDWQIERVTLPEGQFGVVCYFYELTAQKRAEAALRINQAQQRQILDNVNIFIGLVDPQGVMTEANSASAAAAGVSKEELVGMPFADAPWWSNFEEARDYVQDSIERALAGERVQCDLTYHLPDGETRWVDYRAAPVLGDDGSVIAVVPSGVDITKRKKAEHALAERETAYRLALTAGRSGAWSWDIVNDNVTWSPEVGRLLAIEDQDCPRTIGEFLKLVAEGDRADIQSTIEEILNSPSLDYEIECRMRRGDTGEYQWTRGVGEIIRSPDGKPLSIRGLVSDIDELRSTQKVARKRDQRIQSLLNSTAEGIYGIDHEGTCTFANPSCVRMLGFGSATELIGRNMHKLAHHSYPDKTPYPVNECRIYQSFQTGEQIHVDDEVFWREDGSSFPVEYWSYPIEEGGRVVGSVVTFLNITARREAEQNLRSAAERLGLALEVGEMGVWDWDMRTGVVEWSDYHYTLCGYEMGEITPSFEAWRARVHPDDLQRVDDVLDHAKANKSVYECSYRFQHPNGDVLHVIARGRFFYSGTGQPVRMIGVIDDVTKLKAAEAHREMLMGELNHRVKNTLATIQAMASHTLRNATSTEAFRETFIGRLHAIASAHDILTDTTHAGARLTDLISRQVGPYADLDSDRLHLDGPDVTLDPTSGHALGLVLHELATNASKYGALSTPSGRIDITWTLGRTVECRMMILQWRESGGPPVQPPERSGFGSRLIEQSLTLSLAGEVELNYDSDGFNAVLKVPMEAGYG